VTGYAELKPLLTGVLTQHPRQYWIGKLQAAGVPCGSVRNFGETFGDPQIAAREMIASVEHSQIGATRVLGTPLKLSDTPAAVRSAPPALGQHTDAVLANDLGLSRDAIGDLRIRRVI
jgi:crotonobetainyl-CoA:carnitine CoA-transferase CaiB-like acyl-CoA transferase